VDWGAFYPPAAGIRVKNFNMQKCQNMENSNSTTFQGLSRAWNFFQKFKDFQGLLKDTMNLECTSHRHEYVKRCASPHLIEAQGPVIYQGS